MEVGDDVAIVQQLRGLVVDGHDTHCFTENVSLGCLFGSEVPGYIPREARYIRQGKAMAQ